ncbi:hypothetical protein FQN60_007850 [Etheostoma spectabile]|uniref:Large proline-rich protein BAG6 n=1 Tax=Etheostoma spectabile TaxID=54343 RepID=A0A5J5D402_9PERO|nr:hypothetical protein FQN60_007850 [Etheostoma spectabile]
MTESSGMIKITVKTLDSQSRSYKVRGELTVKQLKEQIASSVEIPVDKQRLIYQGRVLQDDSTLTEYNMDGKVIHLVERAPPLASMPDGGAAGVSTGEAENRSSSSHASTSSQGAPHDRNSYVMLGTFNLPVNIMDPQQIQMSVQQMMAGVGGAGRNAMVSTNSGSNGSVDMQINVEQSVQSEPRMRLQLAENLLRDVRSLIHRLEGVSSDGSPHSQPEVPQSSSSTPPSSSSVRGVVASELMDTSSLLAPSSSTSAQTEGPANTGPNHPSPAEFVEVLSEVRRVEERLRPFIERSHSILIAATSADYNNNTQEREEDQRILNLVADALRILGNSLVVLGELRCNLSTSPPRHLSVTRLMAHYTQPVLLQTALPHMPIPINLGSTVTMTSNRRQAADGHELSDQQATGHAPPLQSHGTSHHQGQGGPRVIRLTHQTMEPVVAGQPNNTGTGQSGLPPEFMQAIVQQISQQAAAMAAAASTGNPAQSTHPAQARVVITRPSPSIPQPSTAPAPSSLTQMISGLVGQLLMPGQPGDPGPASTNSQSSSISSSSDSSTVSPPPPSTHTTRSTFVGQPAEGSPEGNLAQLLGSLLGGPEGSGPAPSITVTLPGVTGFIQGMSDFTPPPASGPGAPISPQSTATASPQAGSDAGGQSLSPELFTGIVQGVLSTMMSSLEAQQGSGESIAQFVQRLSQSSSLFTPGSGDAVGFFGELLSLLCQSFSMVDMTAAEELIDGLEEYIAESFVRTTSNTQTSYHTFGPRLLLLCTQGLFECLALNLYCLGGEQRSLTAVINHRIRRMSAEVNPSLVNWLTSMMSMRLHVILEHNPVTEDQIQHYIIYTQAEEGLSLAPGTTAEGATASSRDSGERGTSPRGNIASSGDSQCTAGAPTGWASPELEPWAAAVPPEWVPIIRHDMLSQRKIRSQPPLSDGYLHGMPAKRRKTTQCEGPHLSLSDAVSRAARATGALPVTTPNCLQGELERLQEAYTKQVKSDIKERVRDDPDYNAQRFPKTHQAFSIEDS